MPAGPKPREYATKIHAVNAEIMPRDNGLMPMVTGYRIAGLCRVLRAKSWFRHDSVPFVPHCALRVEAVPSRRLPQRDQRGTNMTEDRTLCRNHRPNPAGAPFPDRMRQTAPAVLRADGAPCERSGDLDIDLERVVYDPTYREWVRNELNRVPSSEGHPTRREV
jgi:hypothetical protein